MNYSHTNLLLHHFTQTPKIGRKTLEPILDIIEDENFSEALSHLETLPPHKKDLLKNALVNFHPEQEEAFLRKHEIQLISIFDDSYPPLLREITDPPFLLYARGNTAILSDANTLSIVGTRKPSRYGIDVTQSLTQEVARAGIIIVSGLALGLDGQAHQATLEAHGKTIAVLGNGLADNCIAPRSHLRLMRAIIDQGGCIVSEFPPETQASTGTFPLRNRIIAGISPATLIVEATRKSGTLITARLALDYNRDVLAIPGSIFSQLSEGSHSLIQEGAKLIHNAQDILTLYNTSSSSSEEKNYEHLSPEEQLILKYLEYEPLSREDLAIKTKLSPDKLSTHLTMLEMNGLIGSVGLNMYRRV
jgi:DNA processing protein